MPIQLHGHAKTPDLADQCSLFEIFLKKNQHVHSGSKHDLVAATMSSAVLNTLSLGTDVPEMPKIIMASLQNRGFLFDIPPNQRVFLHRNIQ